MIQVTRKDSKESLENLLRRFGRKVQQSGVLATAKQQQTLKSQLVSEIVARKQLFDVNAKTSSSRR